jgi:RHS repeat-associated protein
MLHLPRSWVNPKTDQGLLIRAFTANHTPSFVHDTFGELYGQTLAPGASPSVFGFTGEPADANGLVYLRARYYNPILGVFTGLDPLEGRMDQPMSLNRYEYVGGQVMNTVDPTGMEYAPPRPERWNRCALQQTNCERDCANIYAPPEDPKATPLSILGHYHCLDEKCPKPQPTIRPESIQGASVILVLGCYADSKNPYCQKDKIDEWVVSLDTVGRMAAKKWQGRS